MFAGPAIGPVAPVNPFIVNWSRYSYLGLSAKADGRDLQRTCMAK